MPDQTALLHGIIDNPDDELPRQILADWLEDRNAPGDLVCSQFIRTQCELARIDLGDPRRPELEALEQALAPRHPRRWAKRIRRFVRSWSYGRGLIEGVRISLPRLQKQAGILFNAAPIRRLELNVESNLAKTLHSLPRIRALRGLTLLQPRGVASGEARTLLVNPALANLRELEMAHLWFGAWQSWLAHAPCLGVLEKLDLRYSSSGLGRLSHLLPGTPLPALRVLRIDLRGGNAGSPRALPALRQLEVILRTAGAAIRSIFSDLEAPNLQEVLLTAHLDDPTTHSFGNLPEGAMRGLLDRLSEGPLCSLGLCGWTLDRSAIAALLTHPVARNLTRLRLSGLDQQGMLALSEARSLSKLRCLHLEGAERRWPPIGPLFEGPLAEQLEILTLKQMGVGERELVGLHESPLREVLRLLDLSHNDMRDQTGEALAEFAAWPRLVHLNLSHAVVRDLTDLRQLLGQRLQY